LFSYEIGVTFCNRFWKLCFWAWLNTVHDDRVLFNDTLLVQFSVLLAMAQDIQYDYEYSFNDGFDINIYNANPISQTDTDNTLQLIVATITNKLSVILTTQPGIRCICSYGHHDANTFKITVTNTHWVPA